MNSRTNYQRNLISFFTIIAILFNPNLVSSQTIIKGKVKYKGDASPAAFVNVEIVNRKGVETMTNFAGNFSLQVPDSKSNDTLMISAVGYQSIRMPVYVAVTRSEFVLTEAVKSLAGVTVFNKQQVVGSMSESVGYYRSWKHENTGGEIGRIFSLPYDKFVVDKIRFKAGNLCDTCLLRLHIREVNAGVPGDEILNDSISVMVNKLSLDSKIPEFDLTPYNIVFTENEFFVGIEVLNCTNGNKGACSFSFAGSDKGEYLYKSTAEGQWNLTDDYTIYLKLFLRF